MKIISKLFLISILIIGYSINVFAQNSRIDTKDQAWEIVKKKVLKNNTENINVYVSNKIIKANSQIKTLYSKENSPTYDSWFFFIDDKPFASWSHSCRYVFVNIQNGKMLILNKDTPVHFWQMEPLIEQKTEMKEKPFNFTKHKIKSKNVDSAENDYAVIINGGGRKEINWIRYWNHCSFLYSTLVNTYGYSEDHIYVLVSDGTDSTDDRKQIINDKIVYDSSPLDLDGDGDNDIQYSATKENISQVFNTLQNILTPDDNLFIYTTDHGGQESGQNVTLGLWNETMRDDEFATEVNKVNAGRINICMVQCHSGGFIDDLQGSNRIITTSCKYNEGASAMPPDYLYSEFTYHWISAIAGETPYGNSVDADSNNDSFVSMFEAFNYAKNQDTRPDETPQYNSTPSSLGSYMALNGQIPYITGPSPVCTSNSTFTLNNLPSGVTIDWDCSSNMEIVTEDTSTCTVRALNSFVNGSGTVTATINAVGCEPVVIEKEIWVNTKPPTISPPFDAITHQAQSVAYTEKEYNFWGLVNGEYIHDVSNNYLWTIVSPEPMTFPSLYNGEMISYTSNYPGVHTFKLRYNGECGWSPDAVKYVDFIESGYYSMIISPNPASDNLTVEIIDETNSKSSKEANIEITDIKLYNNMQIPVYTNKKYQKRFDVNVGDLPTGVYHLQVIYKGEKISKQVLIQH